MILREAIDQYVTWQRSHGAHFVTSAFLLQQFCKSLVGTELTCQLAR